MVDQATWASEAGAGGRPSFEAAQWFKIENSTQKLYGQTYTFFVLHIDS